VSVPLHPTPGLRPDPPRPGEGGTAPIPSSFTQVPDFHLPPYGCEDRSAEGGENAARSQGRTPEATDEGRGAKAPGGGSRAKRRASMNPRQPRIVMPGSVPAITHLTRRSVDTRDESGHDTA